MRLDVILKMDIAQCLANANAIWDTKENCANNALGIRVALMEHANVRLSVDAMKDGVDFFAIKVILTVRGTVVLLYSYAMVL